MATYAIHKCKCPLTDYSSVINHTTTTLLLPLYSRYESTLKMSQPPSPDMILDLHSKLSAAHIPCPQGTKGHL